MPRPKGSRNKKTIEREKREALFSENVARVAALQAAAESGKPVEEVVKAAMPLKKLGKDILSDFANTFAGMAAHFQPWPGAKGMKPTDEGQNPNVDEERFRIYSALAMQASHQAAPFESPRLSAVAIGAAIVNEVEVKGGMPDDFKPPVEAGKVIDIAPGTIVTPDELVPAAGADRKDEPGAAAA